MIKLQAESYESKYKYLSARSYLVAGLGTEFSVCSRLLRDLESSLLSDVYPRSEVSVWVV